MKTAIELRDELLEKLTGTLNRDRDELDGDERRFRALADALANTTPEKPGSPEPKEEKPNPRLWI